LVGWRTDLAAHPGRDQPITQPVGGCPNTRKIMALQRLYVICISDYKESNFALLLARYLEES
jgi:hypothetical protein